MTTSWDIQGFRDTGRGTEQMETIATVHELEYSGEWMGDEYVTVTVKSPVPIEFKHGDYLVYRGTNYTIDYDTNVIKKAKTFIENDVKKGTYGEGFVYENIKLYAESRELKDVMFKDYVLNDNGKAYSKQTRFSFFAGSVEDLADRLYANLKLVFRETWKVYTPSLSRTQTRLNSYEHWSDYYITDQIAGNTDVNVSCDGISCWDALKLAYDLFGLSYHIIGTNIIIAAEKGLILKENMRYGKGKDFFEIEKNTDDSQQVVTKMYAYGSSDNMPLNYYANLYKTPYLTGVKYIYTEKGKTYYGINTTIPYEDCKNALNGQDGILRIRKASGFSCVGKKDTHTSSGIKYLRINFLADGESVVINGETVTGNASAFYTAISNNETLYFTYGIEQNAWPQSYIQTGGDYPALLSISHLMLPGFPMKSLYQWALENQWTAVDVTKGKATKDGKTYYFSKDEKSPWIKSVNADVIGEREGSVYFDGSSNDTENIHPTIENTNAANVTSDTTITDNGYLPEGSDLSFKLNVSKGILAWDGAWDSRQEDIYVNMKSGYCTGRAFKLLKRPVMKSDHWELKLERSKDGSLDRYFPYSEGVGSDYAQIKTGDTFVVTGIQLPDSYVDAASVTLFDAALKELDKMDHPKRTYIPKINELEVARERDSQNDGTGTFYYRVRPGMKMMFRDSDIIDNAVEISRFIDNVTIKENGKNGIPTFSVVLRDEKEESFRQLIQNEISSLSSGSGSSSSGGGMTESQIYEITDEKVDTDWFSQLFEVHKITKSTTQGGQDTDEIIPPNEYDKLEADDNTISIEAKYGFWTEKYLSALGKGSGSGSSGTVLEWPLLNINGAGMSRNPQAGDTIVYDPSVTGDFKWGKAGGSEDDILKSPLTEINKAGLASAPANGSLLLYRNGAWGYNTIPYKLEISDSNHDNLTVDTTLTWATGTFSIDIKPLLDNYLSQDDADSRYVKISWFKKLFRANDANNAEINPNVDSVVNNLKILVGTWTEQYVSALGQGSGGGGGGTALNYPLMSINDINANPTSGQVGYTLVWNGSSWGYGTSGIDQTALSNYLTTNNYIKADTATKWWGQTMSNGIVTGAMTGVTSIDSVMHFEFIGTSYRVGIGTNDPEAKLHVVGNSKLWGNITMNGSITGLNSIDGLMYFDSAKVGIGVSSPDSKLHVSGNVTANNFIAGTANGSYIKIGPIRIEYEQSTNSLKVYDPTDNTVANLYTTGGVSALGAGSGGGAATGMDWEALEYYDNQHQIDIRYLDLSSYALKSEIPSEFNLQKASSTVLGGVKVGDTLEIDGTGVLNQKSGVATVGTYFKATVDTYGRVTGGSDSLAASDIPTLTVAKISDLSLSNGVITIGANNTITPLTDAKLKNDYEWWGAKLDATTMKREGDMSNVGNISFQASGKNIGGVAYFDTTANAKKLGINQSSPAYTLDVNGSIRVGTAANLIAEHSTNSKHLELSCASNELLISGAGSSSLTMHVNYRASQQTSKYVPVEWQWHDGSSDSWTKFVLGSLEAKTSIKIGGATITWDDNNQALHIDKGVYSDTFVSALGAGSGGSSGGGIDMNDVWSALGAGTNEKIANSHLSFNINNYATTDDLNTAIGNCVAPSDIGTLTINNQTWNPYTDGDKSITISGGGGLSWSDLSTSGNQKIDNSHLNFTLKTALSRFGDYAYHGATDLDWGDDEGDDAKVVTSSMLAYWNGAYTYDVYQAKFLSNLAYCNQGAFGTIVTKSDDYYIPIKGSSNIRGDLYPAQNLTTLWLGRNDRRWEYVYANNIVGDGNITMGGDMSASGTVSGRFVVAGESLKATTIYSSSDGDMTIQGSLSSGDLSLCAGGGNVGVGSSANSNYKLYINGNTKIAETLDINGFSISKIQGSYYIGANTDTWVVGDWYGSFIPDSDQRDKDFVQNTELSLEDVARAPIIEFTWKDKRDNRIHLGTYAQYWEYRLTGAVVTKPNGHLAMDYGATALAAAVMTARTVLTHEEQIAALTGRLDAVEQENKAIKAENAWLRQEVELLKAA